jgi:hypothetical protein
MNKETPPNPQKPWPIVLRIVLRVFGVVLVLLALRFYIEGLHERQAGDIRVGQNYRGMTTATTIGGRVALVLGIGGVIVFALSFPSNERKDENDKDSS